jgi:hypothetical protein
MTRQKPVGGILSTAVQSHRPMNVEFVFTSSLPANFVRANRSSSLRPVHIALSSLTTLGVAEARTIFQHSQEHRSSWRISLKPGSTPAEELTIVDLGKKPFVLQRASVMILEDVPLENLFVSKVVQAPLHSNPPIPPILLYILNVSIVQPGV